jgi:hypothetical protein
MSPAMSNSPRFDGRGRWVRLGCLLAIRALLSYPKVVVILANLLSYPKVVVDLGL